MATPMRQLLARAHDDLRIHPTRKWLRASVGDRTVVDSRRALIVWEPRRVVPSYAVPPDDIDGELVPWEGAAAEDHAVTLEHGPPVLDPSTGFTRHTAPGEALTVRTRGGEELAGAAFRPDDSDLGGAVVLDWDAFDTWREEDQVVVGHPHDPFSRIDCLRSTRHVVVSAHGVPLADSRRPTLLYETSLPTRFYLPREDVAMELLEGSDSHTTCAYKGTASYWSARLPDGTHLPDIAWTYEEGPRRVEADALPVLGLVCFYAERLDLTVDGELQQRPRTPWS